MSGNFNPRSSCEERRQERGRKPAGRTHFNPRSSCEERQELSPGVGVSTYFNPRSSCEERRGWLREIKVNGVFQSTLLMRGATIPHDTVTTQRRISIHAPHARSDQAQAAAASAASAFQSTLLMRGATSRQRKNKGRHTKYFNPRSSCEERRASRSCTDSAKSDFNPRSSCEERRCNAYCYYLPFCNFNPRSSCEERHGCPAAGIVHVQNFNPRSSCEERPADNGFIINMSCISIHAPHARSDLAIN